MGVSPRSTVFVLRFTSIALAAAMGASLLAQPAPVTLTEPATPLLPQRFGAWTMQATATTGEDASQIDPTHVTELKEDGLKRFSTAKYARGGATLDVQALQFVDATGASAALSLYRASHAGLRALPAGEKLATEAAAGNGEVLLRTGNTIVIANSAQVQASELQALANTLPKISGPKGMSPLLPTLLPAKGLDRESVRYSLGPVSYAGTGGALPAAMLGFDKAAEEATANYAIGPSKGTLTLLLYPTPEIAGERGRALAAWANEHHDTLGTVKMRREGPLVLMTTGALPADEAQRMIENIHLKSLVTWDKPMPPEFHTEVRKTYSLLLSITVLCGVLMAAALLLGLFLGMGRASIRVLMGKPAALEPEFLGLGLERGPTKAVHRQDDPAVG